MVYGMMARQLPVHTYHHTGLWLDIGRVEDFQKAQDMDWDGDTVPSQAVLT